MKLYKLQKLMLINFDFVYEIEYELLVDFDYQNNINILIFLVLI